MPEVYATAALLEVMVREWIDKNSEAFERDILRDFCLTSEKLGEQIHRFALDGNVSFSIIQFLVGEPRNKGMLWRLKDMAHHIFLSPKARGQAAPLLDWTLGYIFHESLKLMEDAHQRQFYAPRVDGTSFQDGEPVLAEVARELAAIQAQTIESIRREVTRLAKLLQLSRKLFCVYFSGCSHHGPLARFLYDETELVKRTFADEYPRLLQSVYGDQPERLYAGAAGSLLESGRFADAAAAIEAALERNAGMAEALALREELRRLQERRNARTG